MSVHILHGDCMDVLKGLPDESVHCIVSSPPYWRQRDYGMAGQLGLESTPEEYVDRLTAVFAECRRVLRQEGTCWVNLGDKWAAGSKWGGATALKDKDLVGVPWMLAFAMRAEGWYLRQCNIWAKPNCMPESVTDRSTAAHEYVFHFSKQNDYWYDNDAARTPAAPSSETRLQQNVEAQDGSDRGNGRAKTNGPMRAVSRKVAQGNARTTAAAAPGIDSRKHQDYGGANLRSVWWISPAQYREGHYAVMPDALAEICIAAGCPAGGTVLDPFGGAGTTGLVADRMQRNAILIELNPEYAAMAEKRIWGDAPLFADIA